MFSTMGIRHIALRVTDLSKAHVFYETVFGMKVVWQPDPDNLYLSSGRDNLALHQIPKEDMAAFSGSTGQFLDHFGFLVANPESVDHFFEGIEAVLKKCGGSIVKPPRRHRDDSYSCYIADPDGNHIQILYEPTISTRS